MNISQTDFKKVGVFTLNKTRAKCLIKIVHDENMTKEELGDLCNRAYCITINEKIKKIGYTDDNQGIKNIAGYGVGNSGDPSTRTVGIHYLIANALTKGDNVGFYVKWTRSFKIQLEGLTTVTEEVTTSISGKDLEARCLDDYQKSTGTLPEWNKQEGGRDRDWAPIIKKVESSIKGNGDPITREYADSLEPGFDKDICELYLLNRE